MSETIEDTDAGWPFFIKKSPDVVSEEDKASLDKAIRAATRYNEVALQELATRHPYPSARESAPGRPFRVAARPKGIQILIKGAQIDQRDLGNGFVITKDVEEEPYSVRVAANVDRGVFDILVTGPSGEKLHTSTAKLDDPASAADFIEHHLDYLRDYLPGRHNTPSAEALEL